MLPKPRFILSQMKSKRGNFQAHLGIESYDDEFKFDEVYGYQPLQYIF